jgi:hypothetical protein
MANKKRMEQDPSIDPKTGKKRERRLKDDADKRPSIIVDGIDLSSSLHSQIRHLSPEKIKEIEEKMRVEADKMAQRVFGGGQHDPISIEGRPDSNGRHSGIFGSWADYVSVFDSSEIMSKVIDDPEIKKMMQMYAIPQQEVNVVERSLWQLAMDVWDYPSGVRFTVWRPEGQASTLLTVEYLDPDQEVEEPLVKNTVEFTDEALEQTRDGSGPELVMQRKLEELKNNCDADMAAFEPDPGEVGEGEEGA